MSNNEKTRQNNGLCIAGFILGIIGVCISFIPIINNLSFLWEYWH